MKAVAVTFPTSLPPAPHQFDFQGQADAVPHGRPEIVTILFRLLIEPADSFSAIQQMAYFRHWIL